MIRGPFASSCDRSARFSRARRRFSAALSTARSKHAELAVTDKVFRGERSIRPQHKQPQQSSCVERQRLVSSKFDLGKIVTDGQKTCHLNSLRHRCQKNVPELMI